jgi:glycine/D-amino acid oxidase-like deaminating enzyme
MGSDHRCAGTVELGGTKLGPSKAPIKLLRRRVAEAFPKMSYDKTEEWFGFRPTAPDSLPLIGQLKESGVYTAFGHQHIGMTSGPKTGRLIADIITKDLQILTSRFMIQIDIIYRSIVRAACRCIAQISLMPCKRMDNPYWRMYLEK